VDRVSVERDSKVHIVADGGMVNGWIPGLVVFGMLD
jgi:hypothetical protein